MNTAPVIVRGEAIDAALAERFQARSSRVRALWRLFFMALTFVLLLPCYLLCLMWPRSWSRRRPSRVIEQWWCCLVLWVARIRVRLLSHDPATHEPSQLERCPDQIRASVLMSEHPTVWVGNHVSFTDIACLKSRFDLAFVAAQRSGLSGWAKFLARVADTQFVVRQHLAQMPQQIRAMRRQMLTSTPRMVLFGEGTTSDGTRVLSFRGGFFSVLWPTQDEREDRRVLDVQPFAIHYRSLSGIALSPALRDVHAWYGDMLFWSHFLRALGLRGVLMVDCCFCPVLRPSELQGDIQAKEERRRMVQQAHEMVVRTHQWLQSLPP